MNKFPLLKLQKEAPQHVVKIMDFIPLIALSLVSKTAKALVATAKVQFKTISMDLRSGYNLLILETADRTSVYLFSNHYGEQLQPPPKQLNIALVKDSENRRNVWKNLRLSYSQWVIHLKSIFVIQSPVRVLFCKNEYLRTEDICANLVGITGSVSFNACRGQRLREIVTNFLPTIEILEFVEGLPRDMAAKISIQNLTSIADKSHETACLENLLLSNAAHIRPSLFSTNPITDKTINRFLKCWIRGSNPRLEQFEYYRLGVPAFDVNAIFKRIRVERIPENVERRLTRTMLACSENSQRVTTTRGGYDIRNKVGKVVTLLVDRYDLEILVWH